MANNKTAEAIGDDDSGNNLHQVLDLAARQVLADIEADIAKAPHKRLPTKLLPTQSKLVTETLRHLVEMLRLQSNFLENFQKETAEMRADAENIRKVDTFTISFLLQIHAKVLTALQSGVYGLRREKILDRITQESLENNKDPNADQKGTDAMAEANLEVSLVDLKALFGTEAGRKRLGTIIKDARKESGMNQTELAEATDSARQVISDIERGQGNPTFDYISRILNELN